MWCFSPYADTAAIRPNKPLTHVEQSFCQASLAAVSTSVQQMSQRRREEEDGNLTLSRGLPRNCPLSPSYSAFNGD